MKKIFFGITFAFLAMGFAWSGNVNAPLYKPAIDPAWGNLSAFDWMKQNKFEMRQSYSMGYAAWSGGSMSSALYLNNVSYAATPKLTLFMEMGMSNIFFAQGQMFGQNFSSSDFDRIQNTPQLVMPSFGMHYQYSKSTSFSAYIDFSGLSGHCGGYSSPFGGCSSWGRSSWSRSPF